MENVFVEIVNVWLIFTQTKDVVSLRLYFYSIILIVMRVLKKLVHNFAARWRFKPCIKVPRGIPCHGIHIRSNGIMQGERGDSVEKHFIGFYRMHLIMSLSGLLNQKA